MTDEVVEPVSDEVDLMELESALSSTDGVDYGGGCWLDLYGTVSEKDANGTVIARHVVKVNMTSHARTPEGALRNLMSAVAVAGEVYKLHPWNPNDRAVPAQTAGAKPAASTSAPAPTGAPAAPKPAASVPATSGAPAPVRNGTTAEVPGQGGTIHATKMVVKADRTDGKVTIQFWASGKYPELAMIKTPEAAAKLLADGTGAAWEATHFEKTAEFNTPFNVAWVYGDKASQSGHLYKNVVSVTG